MGFRGVLLPLNLKYVYYVCNFESSEWMKVLKYLIINPHRLQILMLATVFVNIYNTHIWVSEVQTETEAVILPTFRLVYCHHQGDV